jgi:hypothetical protein
MSAYQFTFPMSIINKEYHSHQAPVKPNTFTVIAVIRFIEFSNTFQI